ncbi:hypothetical protein [Bacillus cereus]
MGIRLKYCMCISKHNGKVNSTVAYELIWSDLGVAQCEIVSKQS